MLESNDSSSRSSTMSEETFIWKKLQKLGFDVDSMQKSVKNEMCDQACGLYWLLHSKMVSFLKSRKEKEMYENIENIGRLLLLHFNVVRFFARSR